MLGTHLSLTVVIESGESMVSNKKGLRKMCEPTNKGTTTHLERKGDRTYKRSPGEMDVLKNRSQNLPN